MTILIISIIVTGYVLSIPVRRAVTDTNRTVRTIARHY